MACKKFCRKARLAEDSEWLAPALEIFLRAHCLLKNFMDFWRFHSSICCTTNYDAVPLQGALDIVPLAVTSIICGKVLKKGSQRPELFNDVFPCDRCRDAKDIPEHIVRKMNLILMSLQKCCDIEDVICQIKSVMCVLEVLPACAMSERLQTLSRLLGEMMRKLICCGQLVEEPFSDRHIRLTLTLVTNFIRDWSEKRSRARPCLRICRFCDHVISETSRQWGTFCCIHAQQFNCIRKEWLLRQSISDAYKQEQSDWMAKPRLLKSEPCTDIDDDSRPHTSIETLRTMGVIRSVQDRSAKFDVFEDPKGSPGSADQMMKMSEISVTRRQDGEPRTRAEAGRRERDKFDRAEGRDLTKTMPGRSLTDEGMREEIKRRNIDGTGGYPIKADGREKRDDVPYRSKPGEIRGLRDESEKRTASGKTRKIKRDSARSDRLERTPQPSGTESEGKVDRPRGKKKSASPETEKSTRSKKLYRRSLKESEIDKSAAKDRRKLYRDELEESEKEKSSTKGKRRRKLYRNEVDDDGTEKVNGTDDDERMSGRRRRKKRQEGDMEMDDETVVRSGSKASRRRRRKTSKADGYDSEERDTSYTVDEEGKVRKGRKRRSRLRDGEGNPGTSTEDKSSPDSEDGPKKGTSVSSKKRRRQSDSPRTDDEYSKASGSRYIKGRLPATRIPNAIDDRARIEYQLSDPHFVQLGWTILPVAKTMRKIARYQAKPAKPHLDWFKKHRLNGRIYYDDGVTVFVNFLSDGSAEVFYPQGEVVAIRYQRPGNCKYDMYTVFSPGGKDCMGVERKSQIVAVFDTIGNGVVLDEDGATRLSYNQIGGIWRDNPTGVPLIWRWGTYEHESVTKIVYVEKPTVHLEKLLHTPRKILKSTASTKSSSPRNKEKKFEEQKPVVETNAEQEEGEEDELGDNIYASYVEDTYHFKTISLHLNNYISLRIFNRSNINLQFREEKQILKIELGTIVNMSKIVETYFVDSNSKDAALRSKYEMLLKTNAKLDSCLYDVAMEFEKVRTIARQRKFMMNKYRPYLREWLKSGTRCRPRCIN